MKISYVPDPENHPLWDGIKGLLRPAADYGEIPVRDDDEAVWIAFEGQAVFGAATTLLWDDGEAEIRCCGGRHMGRWVGLGETVLSDWARKNGARKITMRGRKGWARILRAFGWVALGIEDGRTLYEKRL